MRLPRLVSMVGIALVLCACVGAGREFVRPGDEVLVVGSTTMHQAVALLGEPDLKKSYQFENDRVIEVLHYLYVRAGAEASRPGVTAVRSLNLLFDGEVLVGRRFVSSFKIDSTRFDSNLVSKIAPGMAEHDVIALLGKPSGLYAYPKIASRGDTALVYGYSETIGSNTSTDILIVELDPNRVVRRSYRDRFVSYATAQLASEYGPRQKRAAERFTAGWPKLRQGMPAGEVYELLGPSCGLFDLTVSGAERSLGRAIFTGSLDFAPHMSRRELVSYLGLKCTLEFDRGRLSVWTVSQ